MLRQRTKKVAKELVDGEYLQKELGEHLQKGENIPVLAGVLKTVRAEAPQDSGPNTVYVSEKMLQKNSERWTPLFYP